MNKSDFVFNVFNNCAPLYAERFKDQSAYAAGFDRFCDALPGDFPSVLELGCGPGTSGAYLLNKRTDIRLTGIDLAPAMVAYAGTLLPEAQFQVWDIRRLTEFPGVFSGIMGAFCLPYIDQLEAAQLIRDAAKKLLSGGVLYLSTMEDAYEKSGWELNSKGQQVFMHYHESGYLTQALLDAGFEILESTRQPYFRDGASAQTDWIVIARLISSV